MMKRAYSRGGFSIVALYGVLSLISGLFLGIFAGTAVGLLLLKDANIFEMIAEGSLSEIMSLFSDPSISYALMLGMVLGSIAGMLVGLLIMKKILPRENPKPIEKRSISGRDFGRIVLMAFGLWGLGVLLGSFPSFFGYEDVNPMLDNAGKAIIIFDLYAILGAPILEELAFRKLLCDALHPYGSVTAAFTSALLFGLMHGNAAQFMLAFTLGLLLATVYQKTGKIIYTIFLHFMINFFATLPDLFMMGDIDISIVWNVFFGLLTGAGLVVTFLSKDCELLKLDRSTAPDANRQAFHNAGMRVAVIAGTVLVVFYELFMIIMSAVEGFEPGVLIRLIPTAFVVVTVILVTTRVGRHTDPAPEILIAGEDVEVYPVPAEMIESLAADTAEYIVPEDAAEHTAPAEAAEAAEMIAPEDVQEKAETHLDS